MLPTAPLKLFLLASVAERASRRHLELTGEGQDVEYGKVLKELETRDRIDSTRAAAPLRPAEDAHMVDTDGLDLEQVLGARPSSGGEVAMGVSYALGVAMARVCFTAFGRWEVQGREAVPPMGPLMVVSNHLSYADPAYLVASIPRQLRFLGKRSLFSNPLAGKMLTNVGVHPVDREEADIGALRWVLNELRRELPLVLFPEGARSRSGGMARGKAGVGLHRGPVPGAHPARGHRRHREDTLLAYALSSLQGEGQHRRALHPALDGRKTHAPNPGRAGGPHNAAGRRPASSGVPGLLRHRGQPGPSGGGHQLTQ